MKKKLLAAVLCLTLGTVTVQGVFADTTVNVSSDLMNTTVSKENYEFTITDVYYTNQLSEKKGTTTNSY